MYHGMKAMRKYSMFEIQHIIQMVPQIIVAVQRGKLIISNILNVHTFAEFEGKKQIFFIASFC